MATEGLFINIEGPDASGKETQWKKLIDRLRNPRRDENGELEHEPLEVYSQDFPAYDRTDAGQRLHEYLHSEESMPLREEAKLFIEDRYALKDELESALEDGKVVVTDRYSQSNWAYQTTDKGHDERWEFIDWMKEQETDLPQPDVVVYMDMPVEQSLVLLDNRDTTDRNENREKLEKVVSAYREIADKEDWLVIDPMKDDYNGQEIEGTEYLRTPEEIHENVWKAVKPYIVD